MKALIFLMSIGSSLFSVAHAESIACRYRNSLNFGFQGSATAAVVRREVNRLIDECEKVPSTSQDTFNFYRGFYDKCVKICSVGLGNNSSDFVRCKSDCYNATNIGVAKVTGYFDGKEDGMAACQPSSGAKSQPTGAAK